MNYAKKIINAIFGIGLALLPDPVGSEGFRMQAYDEPFLELVGRVEAPRGFSQMSGLATTPPPKPLERMRIGEVLEYQRLIRGQGSASSAAGRYQINFTTLEYLVSRYGISENLVFDAGIQLYLARLLMQECGFYDPETRDADLGNCLAGRWAALPMLSGAGQGRSRYHGDGLNRSLVSVDDFLSTLKRRFNPSGQ